MQAATTKFKKNQEKILTKAAPATKPRRTRFRHRKFIRDEPTSYPNSILVNKDGGGLDWDFSASVQTKNGWFWRIYIVLSPTNRIMMFRNGCLRLKISKFALFYHLWLANRSRFVSKLASFHLVFAWTGRSVCFDKKILRIAASSC